MVLLSGTTLALCPLAGRCCDQVSHACQAGKLEGSHTCCGVGLFPGIQTQWLCCNLPLLLAAYEVLPILVTKLTV